MFLIGIHKIKHLTEGSKPAPPGYAGKKKIPKASHPSGFSISKSVILVDAVKFHRFCFGVIIMIKRHYYSQFHISYGVNRLPVLMDMKRIPMTGL
jgi:hypothetical protein